LSDKNNEVPKRPPVPPVTDPIATGSAPTGHHTVIIGKSIVEGGKQDGKHGSGQTGGNGGGSPSGSDKTQSGKS